MTIKRITTVLSAITVAAVVASCATVKPYQRESLARPEMRAAPWPGVERYDSHTFDVREGTTGATGQAGGGCGCN